MNKKMMLVLVMGMVISGVSHAEITRAEDKTEKKDGSLLNGGAVRKLAVTGNVLQVLPVGLLFSWAGGTYVLVDYPDFDKMADGDAVNCYVVKTEKTYSYESVNGAKRTARVYKFLNRRIGKR